MGKHKTTNDNRKKIQTPQKKSFKTKCERKKEEETVTLARCKTWLKEVKKEKAKAPTTLDTFSSDDEDFPDMSHSERTSVGFELVFKIKDFPLKYFMRQISFHSLP